ncbi:MAG: PD-(D/E)XK nuclease family protein [Tepidiformaceae bacterium]
MNGGLFRIFHTKVTTFDRCRKRYWFRYVSGLPWPEQIPSDGGIIGTGVHRAMKRLCDTGHAADGSQELDAYLRMPAHESVGPGTDRNKLAFELFERGSAAHASIAADESTAEVRAVLPRWHCGVQIEASIDRADRLAPDRWQVIDWKTGLMDNDVETDAQLDIGHVALRTVRALPAAATVRAIAWNLRTGRQRVRELLRDDAANTVGYLERLAVKIRETTEFPATPSGLCSYCEWRPQCPEAAPLAPGAAAWLDEDPGGAVGEAAETP